MATLRVNHLNLINWLWRVFYINEPVQCRILELIKRNFIILKEETNHLDLNMQIFQNKIRSSRVAQLISWPDKLWEWRWKRIHRCLRLVVWLQLDHINCCFIDYRHTYWLQDIKRSTRISKVHKSMVQAENMKTKTSYFSWFLHPKKKIQERNKGAMWSRDHVCSVWLHIKDLISIVMMT